MTGLVLLQHALDVTLPLELADGGTVRQRGDVRIAVANPADRCALEWALQLTDDVTALTVGPVDARRVLDLAVARGAHRAIRVWDEALAQLDASAMSRVLAQVVRLLAPDVVLAGDRGLEGATGILPGLIAARLGWPWLAGALRVAREADGLVIEQRLGAGRRQELAAACPLVVTVVPGSIEPRYVSVRARQRATQRPVEPWDLGTLGLASETVRGWIRLSLDRVDWPRPRPRRSAQAARSASAAERMRQLMGGGAQAAKPAAEATTSERRLEGDPERVAERLLAILESRGFV